MTEKRAEDRNRQIIQVEMQIAKSLMSKYANVLVKRCKLK